MNRIKFKVDDVEYCVRKPKPDEVNKGQAVWNKKWSAALQDNAPLRLKVLDILTQQGLWDSALQEESKNLEISIQKNRDVLDKGGIKKSEARKIAIQIRLDLNRLNYINRNKNSLDRITAESQADQARFEYYVSVCTVTPDTDKPIFKDLAEYLERSKDANDDLTYQASMKMMYLLADVDPDAESNTSENKFLREFGFVDEKLRLIDGNKKLIDADGRHIDEEGRFVKWNEDFTISTFVDIDGNPVDSEGNPLSKEGNKVEKLPFLDD